MHNIQQTVSNLQDVVQDIVLLFSTKVEKVLKAGHFVWKMKTTKSLYLPC